MLSKKKLRTTRLDEFVENSQCTKRPIIEKRKNESCFAGEGANSESPDSRNRLNTRARVRASEILFPRV